jgi:hypothetical protein
MIPRGTIAGITVVLVAACGIAGVARQGGAQGDSRIIQLSASLAGQAWEKAVEELVDIGQPAVGPLVARFASEDPMNDFRAHGDRAGRGGSARLDRSRTLW